MYCHSFTYNVLNVIAVEVHHCGKIVFNLLYELSFKIRLHIMTYEEYKIAIARIIASRVLIRNKIVPVKTNFLKFDAADLMLSLIHI